MTPRVQKGQKRPLGSRPYPLCAAPPPRAVFRRKKGCSILDPPQLFNKSPKKPQVHKFLKVFLSYVQNKRSAPPFSSAFSAFPALSAPSFAFFVTWGAQPNGRPLRSGLSPPFSRAQSTAQKEERPPRSRRAGMAECRSRARPSHLRRVRECNARTARRVHARHRQERKVRRAHFRRQPRRRFDARRKEPAKTHAGRLPMLGGLPAGRRPPPTSTHRGGTRHKARSRQRCLSCRAPGARIHSGTLSRSLRISRTSRVKPGNTSKADLCIEKKYFHVPSPVQWSGHHQVAKGSCAPRTGPRAPIFFFGGGGLFFSKKECSIFGPVPKSP